MEVVHANGHMGEMGSSKDKAAEGEVHGLNGYSDRTNNIQDKEKLLIMRKAVEERGCSLQGVDDATLLRFLRARSMVVEKAAKMFVQYKNWRASYMPKGYIPDEEVANELASKKVYLQGTSKQGWPIVIGISRNHNAGNRNLEEFKRFLAHALDKLISSAAPGVEKMLVIIDLEHISYKNVDVRGAIAGFSLLQSYYPERLGKLYMLNVPHMFMQFWKAIRRFIDKETERKIVFVEQQKTMEMLLKDIEQQHIPKIYGGQEELVLLQDVKITNWPPSVQSNGMASSD